MTEIKIIIGTIETSVTLDLDQNEITLEVLEQACRLLYEQMRERFFSKRGMK